jgi:hypothetical protein
MRKLAVPLLLPVLAAGVLLVAAPAATAATHHHHHARVYHAAVVPDLPVPPGDPSAAWCRDASQVTGPALLIPGFGEAIAKCMHGHPMRTDVRNCLLATIATTAGVAVGGIIEMVAARVIAGRMIQVGTATCVALIVGT